MDKILENICKAVCDDFFKTICKLLVFFVPLGLLCKLLDLGTDVCAVFGLVYVLRRAIDGEFWVVLILVICPASLGAIMLLVVSISLLVQQPNTSGIPWQHAAYFSFVCSAMLLTFTYWVWTQEWFQSPPAVVKWPLYCTTMLWLAYFSFSSYILLRPTTWQGVQGEVAGQDLEVLKKQVAETVKPYTHKYHFSITVEKAFHVSNPALEERFDQWRESHRERGKSSNRRTLFHGTLRPAAKSIIESGFRLPHRKGMFGKGVYFADTPLKSMQYTRAREGTILLCEVELGNSMMKDSAANHLEAKGPDNRPPEMERSWVMKTLFRQQSFDSVTARAGLFGAVRVPEYVIYNPDQAVPRYLIFFRTD